MTEPTRIRARLPILLSGVLLVAVALLGLVRLWNLAGVHRTLVAVAVGAYLAWIVVESKIVSIREASLPDAPGDRGSFELYAVAQGTTVIVALLLSAGPAHAVTGILGLLLMAAGIGIRMSAIVTLGRLYSRRVRLLEGHETITAGPYALVRHPAYFGTLAGHLGFVVVLGTWIPLLLWLILLVPMVVRRILVEEPVLLRLPGYPDYARRRKRLVPLVW